MASNKRLTKRQRQRAVRETEKVYDRSFYMPTIQPKTETQARLFDEYNAGQNIAAVGSAGTGKTYVSTYLALKDVLENEAYDQVLFVRSAVQSRDQGFMPGTQKEKEAFYELPFIDIVNDLFDDPKAYESLKQRGVIRFSSTSFIRGLTFNNTVVIVDECQNGNFMELKTIATRLGEGSRIIFCGDTKQNDLAFKRNSPDQSGLGKMLEIFERIDSVSVVEFKPEDIVRSGFVKEFILAEEALDNAA